MRQEDNRLIPTGIKNFYKENPLAMQMGSGFVAGEGYSLLPFEAGGEEEGTDRG